MFPVTETAHAPISVLQVLPALKDGGVEESTLALARYLKKPHANLHFKAHVAAASGPKERLLASTGAIFHRLPMASKNPVVWMWTTYQLIKVIRAEHIKVVHARSRACAWPARLAAWWCGLPFVTTFHGIYNENGGWLKHWYNSVMVAGRPVIANSAYTAAYIQRVYRVKPNHLLVAPRGIDMRRFNRARLNAAKLKQRRITLGLGPKTKVFILVGRLTYWKGQHLLLEALSLLPPGGDWVALMVGGAEKRGAYARDLNGFTARLGLEQHVKWLGSRSDVPELLALATLAFSTSTRPEAFGRVAVEAQAMGVPVVASAHGGSEETIIPGKTGWLLPVNERGEVAPQALADCIARALQNPRKLASMGQMAANHVRELYTEHRMASQELLAYRCALGLVKPDEETGF